MSRIAREIGKFDKVTVSTDGPDVILQLPANPSRCHWTDMAQIIEGLQVAIKQAYEFEQKGGVKPGGH